MLLTVYKLIALDRNTLTILDSGMIQPVRSLLASPPVDRLRRRLHDLRISVTDRCNFRCPYCMPKEVFGRDWAFLPRKDLLSFEEVERITRIFVDHGVEKIRITGGEPLLRHGLERLIEMLASINGLRDITLTTNGTLLAKKAQSLKDAGLRRVTVSLDALDDIVFRRMNDINFPVAHILEGIETARSVGLVPLKINMVVKRGVNEQNVVEMAGYFRHSGCIVRFIEYMDVGHSNGWDMTEVVPATEITKLVANQWPLEMVSPNYSGEVARRYRYADGAGEIGVIASVTEPFCGGCTRARITADGQFYTCLFATNGKDLREILRRGDSDADLSTFIGSVWRDRGDRYSELRSSDTANLAKIEMSRVGG